MAADGQLLQGEITEDPAAEERDVERLLAGFLQALIQEQKREPQKSEGQVGAR